VGGVSKLPPAKKTVLRREGPWAIGVGTRAGAFAITTGHADGHRWCRLRIARA